MSDADNDLVVFPGAFDLDVALQADSNLTLQAELHQQKKPFVILDDHDQSLRNSGCLLIESGNRLQLLQPDQVWVSQAGKGYGKFVNELPDGPVRDSLAGFPPLRALTEIGRGIIETGSLAALDELQKTVVRGSFVALRSDAGQVSLASIQRLRGYDRAFETVKGSLRSMAGSHHGLETVFGALFPNVEQYQAKPTIHLGKLEPASEAATEIIRTFIAVARKNEAGVIADIDTEFLHDYRVSLRRVRSVLSLFKGVFSDQETAELKRIFSDLMSPTGRLRDLDVYLLERESYFKLVPPSLHAGLGKMFDQFETERAREQKKLSRRFRSASYDQSMKELAAQFDDPTRLEFGQNADLGAYKYACSLIWKRYRKVCKLARSIDPETPDEAVHELRIHCKKLRYLMEFFAQLFDAKAFKTIIKPLKRLQDNLGDFNDCSVQQDALLAFAVQQSSSSGQVDANLGLSVGGLIAILNQRQQAERERVVSNFQHFDSPDIRELFRILFQTPGD
ncbi:CHAD domain-containing protein [Ruegeria arenilitoris]|uniref:CHAD domain-containing protein n=1 Tax=Ruegeria arenilitoris TaxID=1173585 RepID=UPI00147A3C75|nr:CHAD domain-containing protein [Ruegeria arenilitoris]